MPIPLIVALALLAAVTGSVIVGSFVFDVEPQRIDQQDQSP